MLTQGGPNETKMRPAACAGASVVLVAYMTGDSLFPSIDSALAQPEVGEVVIVDNGSTVEDAARLVALAASRPSARPLRGAPVPASPAPGS